MKRQWRDLTAATGQLLRGATAAETRLFSSQSSSFPPDSGASTTSREHLRCLVGRVAALAVHPHVASQRHFFSVFSGENPFDVAKTERIEEAEEGDNGNGDETWTDDDEVWEEDEDEGVEPEVGDGRDGGGFVLNGVPWGERALALAEEVLRSEFDSNDMKLFAFRVSPRGYIYVRLDKLTDKYGCPSMDEIERFHHLYDESLEECGKHGEIPDNLAVEVSSPGAARLLKVPDDLERFKNFPMVVQYSEEDGESKRSQERNGVLHLVSFDTEAGKCEWKLADVRENRGTASKGRPMSRKMKDWRLTLPFGMVKRVALYLDF